MQTACKSVDGESWDREAREPMHFYLMQVFCDNPQPVNRVSPARASRRRFPGPRFPAIAARRSLVFLYRWPVSRLGKRNSNRLKVSCPLPIALYYLRKYTN